MRAAHVSDLADIESEEIAALEDDWDAERREHDGTVQGLEEQIKDLEEELFELKHLAA
jgi:predicted  nucleic acid-binding Zn-ribbon protein